MHSAPPPPPPPPNGHPIYRFLQLSNHLWWPTPKQSSFQYPHLCPLDQFCDPNPSFYYPRSTTLPEKFMNLLRNSIVLLKSHGSLVWLEKLVWKTFFLDIWNLVPWSLMWNLWREQSHHTFEDAESSVTSLQSLFIRAYLTSVMCGVLPIIIPLLIVKSRYTFFVIYLFIWISKCETLLRTERKRNSASTIQRKCTEAVNWNQLRVHRSKNSSQFENQRATQNSHPIKKSAKK